MNLTGQGIHGLPADLSERSIVLTNDGVNLVTNGTFTGSATGWTLATGWAYSSNTVIKNGAGTGALEQAIGAQANVIYALTYTVSNWTAGTSLTPSIGGVDGTAITGNETASTQYIVSTGTGNLKFTPTTDVRCTIDTVTVYKLSESVFVNSSGTITGWVRGDGVASLVGLTVTNLAVTGTITGIAVTVTESLTMAAGAITMASTGADKRVIITVDTSGGAAENLTAINGGTAGMIVELKSANNARVPTVVSGGTLYLQADFTLNNTHALLTLLCTAANTFVEKGRATNV